jgi:hypothetical protein
LGYTVTSAIDLEVIRRIAATILAASYVSAINLTVYAFLIRLPEDNNEAEIVTDLEYKIVTPKRMVASI